MKTTVTRLIMCKFLMVFAFYTNAQTISDFENLTLSADTFWNGSDLSAGFNNGNAFFTNTYDSNWDYWSEGFVYSNMKDSVTAGSGNLYSARTAIGNNNSANYAVGQEGAIIRLENSANGGLVDGLYITNNTYAAISMRDGDAFAKQFGSIYDANGNVDGTDGEDWFKLSITGFYNNAPINDTVDFYLADFRFTDNTQDYILTSWEWVDLQVLGNLDSLVFHLSSSDVGTWGMNTPDFFCLDDFTTLDSPLLVKNQKDSKPAVSIYPNPADDQINISFNGNTNSALISIRDLSGREILKQNVYNSNLHNISLSDYPSGFYIVEVSFEDNSVERNIFIKK
ncbi:MAG: DUF4465 domain-containing protein [Bacteroidota bacterium]|nr:DUF4465 domain-containing protein [Bacteroidota bacterium]